MGSAPEGIPRLGILSIGIRYLWVTALVKRDSFAWPEPKEVRLPPIKRAAEQIENEKPGLCGCGRMAAYPEAILN
jgi:hypothetical protein